MRLTTILIFTFIHVQTSGQSITGKYHDFFGHSLEFNKDSTFRYDWKFDLVHNWAIGNWTASGRKIHLQFVNVYDTLSRTNKTDSLVLSVDEKSNRINAVDFATTMLVSGGQGSEGMSTELFKKGQRLFLIDKNGKLDRSKHQGIWPQRRWPWGYKKWPTWYNVVADDTVEQ